MYFVDGDQNLFHSTLTGALQSAWEVSSRRNGERISVLTALYVEDTQIEVTIAYVEAPPCV